MVDRRKFLAASVATLLASQIGEFAGAATPESTDDKRNLIPRKSSGAPNYWCTWAAQNYMYGQGFAKLDPKILEGQSGSRLAHDALIEEILFGRNGWVKNFFPKIRGDVLFLLDDGWESGGPATFELDIKKFPAFAGTPAERLRSLNQAIQKAGWRGAALWCRNPQGGAAGHRLENISQSAGITYWKIDIGDPAFDLVRIRNQFHIPLILEHVHSESAVNGNWRTDGRFGAQPWGSKRLEILRHSDVYRTYDVTSILSLPTTLDRVSEMLKGAVGHSEVHGLLNVEDEVYVAAALGCTMGVMRHPLTGMRPGRDVDLFFNGPRQPKRRMDEVARAVRWQRIAPPFAPGIGSISVSDEVLTDSWLFEEGQTWQTDLVGATVRQGAPARFARNIGLPEVKAGDKKPFVFAARFPNGAVAIAAQQRTEAGNGWYMPPCDVALAVEDAPGPFGIFGEFSSLALVFNRRLHGRRILAQDLAGDEAFDISEEVTVNGNKLLLPGKVLRQAGLRDATPGDLSSPGVVIAVV